MDAQTTIGRFSGRHQPTANVQNILGLPAAFWSNFQSAKYSSRSIRFTLPQTEPTEAVPVGAATMTKRQASEALDELLDIDSPAPKKIKSTSSSINGNG